MHLVEFSYNNGYHASTKIPPFEVLYGRKCRALVTWDDPMDRLMLGPDFLKDLENMVNMVKKNLKESQDLKKTYVDKFHIDKEYKVGDHVYLKVEEKKSTLKMGKCSNLDRRYCGPFEIQAKIGPIAYGMDLQNHITVHDVFHVYLLKKYVYGPKHIIDWNLLQVETGG